MTRTDQDLATVPQSVAVVAREQIEFAQRRSSLDEALRGIPGLFVQNRRNYGLSGGIGISIRAPEPRFGLRGLALIQDGIPITTADGTTEPGNVDLGSVAPHRRHPGTELGAVRQLRRRRHQPDHDVRHLATARRQARRPVRQSTATTASRCGWTPAGSGRPSSWRA